MSFVQNALENVAKSMSKQLKDVATKVATDHNVTDVNKMVDDLMVAMGLMEIQVKTTKTKSVSVKSEKKDKESVVSTGKKRVVSKKMKDAFLALEGATEDLLKELIKEYKTAEDVESFDAFSRAKLGLAPIVKETKPKKEKKEKKGRFDKWTPTSTKLFKTITEENEGTVTDELKKDFQSYVDTLSDEDFASASIQGHMRAFITTKFTKEEKTTEDDDEEDLIEFEFEDETLLRGEKSGKIYRSTEEAGDVLIGYIGKGRFSECEV
jgi:hypothetical protein